MSYDSGALYNAADQYDTSAALPYDHTSLYDSAATYDSAAAPVVVSTQQGGSGAGAGGKLSRQAGHFGAAKMGRDGDGYAVDYRHTRAKVLAPVDIEADDEEVVTLLVHMLGEF